MLKSIGAMIALTLAGCSVATAAPLPPRPAATAEAPIVLVRQGCGLAFHRNAYGACVPNGGGYYAGPRAVAPLPPPPPCPPGYARDPRPAVRLCYPI